MSIHAGGACDPSSFDEVQGGARGDAGVSSGVSGADAASSAGAGAVHGSMRDSGAASQQQPDARPSDRPDAETVSPTDAAASDPDPADPGGAEAGSGTPADSGADAGDASAPDAAIDAGPIVPIVPVGESACYSWLAGRLLCDGFETAPKDPPWWRRQKTGELTHVGTPAFIGDGAIAARSLANGGSAFVGRVAYPDLTTGTIYLRSYVYVPGGVPLLGVIVHGMAEGLEPYGGVSILLQDNGVKLDVHPRGPGVAPVFIDADPPVLLPRDKWTCLQMQMTISASQGAVRLTVDGQVAAVITPISTLPASGYRTVTAGIVYSDPDQPPIQLFVDEVVADTSPIPCNLVARDGGVGRGPGAVGE